MASGKFHPYVSESFTVNSSFGKRITSSSQQSPKRSTFLGWNGSRFPCTEFPEFLITRQEGEQYFLFPGSFPFLNVLSGGLFENLLHCLWCWRMSYLCLKLNKLWICGFLTTIFNLSWRKKHTITELMLHGRCTSAGWGKQTSSSCRRKQRLTQWKSVCLKGEGRIQIKNCWTLKFMFLLQAPPQSHTQGPNILVHRLHDARKRQRFFYKVRRDSNWPCHKRAISLLLVLLPQSLGPRLTQNGHMSQMEILSLGRSLQLSLLAEL